MKFRKKPVVIEAMQWDGTYAGAREVCAWANTVPAPGDGPEEPWVDYTYREHDDGELLVNEMQCHSLEGPLNVSPDDWIIRGVAGEFYPCKPDIFAATYEPVGDTPEAKEER